MDCEEGQLDAVRNADFSVDPGEVSAYGRLGDGELCGYFVVAVTLCHELENFFFPRAELLFLRRISDGGAGKRLTDFRHRDRPCLWIHGEERPYPGEDFASSLRTDLAAS